MAASSILDSFRERYPEKFASEEYVFSRINRGDRIFVGTGCGEPQYLVSALVEYVRCHPKAVVDAEVVQVWTLGVAPYADSRFEANFRCNSFFVGDNTREAVCKGRADYTPISLSAIPDLFRRGLVPIDVALVQTSMPDGHGYMSLGVSVDIVKAAVDAARVVVAQVNPQMPRVYGDGFLHIKDVDYIVACDEPLLEYRLGEHGPVVKKIGEHAARLVHDGDTLQVGYGPLPDAILANLRGKKHLGIHTELLSDGVVDLMRRGVVDNSGKTLDPGKTVASFCMGTRKTYDFVGENLSVQFRSVDYTNSPMVIAQQENMVAMNSAYEVDLTGQATAESVGGRFYSGVGGQVDFMRGAALAKNGKSVLVLRSTSEDGKRSTIVPFLEEGAGVTFGRGDVSYVVTEYGIAYLHGKSIRERAMELIAIAHPRFRPGLIAEAKKHKLIYSDQAFISGRRGEYPEEFEAYKTTRTGLEVFLRPVRISDEPLLKDFFYSLSDDSMYRRFISARKDMPHERLQDFVVIDYTQQMVILATVGDSENEQVVGMGQYDVDSLTHTADVAFVVRDDHQNEGVGSVLLQYLTFLAKKQGLLGFTAEVLADNAPMLHLFEKMGFDFQKKREEGVYDLKMMFAKRR